MKAWLRKIFYLDDPAQGVFFALTLWGVGYYLLITFVVMAFNWGSLWWSPPFNLLLPVGIFWLGLVFFPLNYLVLLLFFFDRLTKRSNLIWLAFIGLVGVLTALHVMWPAEPTAAIVEVSVLFNLFWNFVVLSAFMLLLIPALSGRYWKSAFGAFAALLVGTGMLSMPFTYSHLFLVCNPSFCYHRSPIPSSPIPTFPAAVQKFFGIGEYVWGLWVLTGLLFLLLAYLFSAKFLAGLGRKTFRSMFDRRVIALLIVAAVTYLVFQVMAFFAGRQYAAEFAALERYFGRPVSAAGMKQFYYGDSTADPAYWKRVEAIAEKIDPVRERTKDNQYFSMSALSTITELSAADRTRWRQWWQTAEPAIRDYEAAFSGNIPPPKLAFSFDEKISYLRYYEYFFWVELWRMRFALEDDDCSTAWVACQRLDDVTRSLRREIFPAGGRLWLSGIDTQLAGLQLLLESGKLSDDQLRHLDGQLQRLESEFPAMQSRCIYGDVAVSLNCFDLFAVEIWDIYPFRRVPPPYSFGCMRFFLPQLWWYARLARTRIARSYQQPDFNHFPEPEKIDKMSFLVSHFLACSESFGRDFNRALANVRAMRCLIAAEEFKRKHGDYPDAMPDLPIDPLNGKPLLYRKGVYSYPVMRIEWIPDEAMKTWNRWHWKEEIVNTSGPAIQIWSLKPGQVLKEKPDQADPGALFDNGTSDGDVRAMMRLKP